VRGRDAGRAGVGVVLCVAGFVMARGSAYRVTTVMIDAGGCRMVADVVDRGTDAADGAVVLLHGVVANKKIMAYLAQSFAEQNLRVFVPDLPGHGRTAGPFSFARAETCSEALVGQLIAGGIVDPARTILAGHSMGGAIAVRVAAHVRVAGVIAISPAPMSTARGIRADLLPYTNPPPTPTNTLAISASWEPFGIRASTEDLITGEARETSKYLVVPHSTHVSVLFDPRVARASQQWAAHALHLSGAFELPSRWPLVGGVAGLLGLFLVAGPFVREVVGGAHDTQADAVGDHPAGGEPRGLTRFALRHCIEIGVGSMIVVLLLRLGNPLRFVRVFQGDYFASFLLLLGTALLAWHYREARVLFSKWRLNGVIAAAFAAFVLNLMVYTWFDLTLTEAWLTWARWLCFPVVLAAMFPYHVAEEGLLGPAAAGGAGARLWWALLFRFIAWCALLLGLFQLHNGEFLLFLLALYFAGFSVLQRMAMGVVRRATGSALATAVFGAILLAGFSLVIFPVT
jgi:pimeloyl-ACP methyl ester carboxylesterase